MTTTYAQYFDTTSYGWTGAIMIHVETKNPLSEVGGGKNTIPTLLTVELLEWQGSYAATMATPGLMQEDFVVPSENIQQYVWIPFVFHYDLPPGEYMWVLSTQSESPCDGSFRVYYESSDHKFPAWLNGADHSSYVSHVLGLSATETYEKVICEDDTFGSDVASDGLDNVQIKTPSGYKKAIKIYGQRGYVRTSGKKTGRIAGPSHVK